MRVIIHRGSNQIGGNIIEVATEHTRVILDCGQNLPSLDGDRVEDTIAIDGLTRGNSAYDGVLITHYHGDHCGLIGQVNPDIPIYAGDSTIQVLGVIADFIDKPLPAINHTVTPGEAMRVGDIKILPIPAQHSAYGAMMLLIQGDGQRLLYTGDFNGIDDEHLSKIGQIDALICEGTNISKKDGRTEADVEREAAQIMRETAGQVFVLCSTTNIDRINSIEASCRASGRTIAIDPFMKAITDRVGELSLESPIGFVPGFIDEHKRPRIHQYLSGDWSAFMGASKVVEMDNLVFMVRNNRDMRSFIRRLHRVKPLDGSTLIYSYWTGYKRQAYTADFLSFCESCGMEIVDIHASGHAYRELLETLIRRLSPGVLIPVHTEHSSAFLGLHDNVMLPIDGEVINL